MAADVQMMYKGSVSYRNDNVNYIRISPTCEAKVARLDRVFAQISFVDNNDQAVNIPAGVDVVFQSDQSPAARVGQVFLVSWVENYVVRVNGAEQFRLENQKQQSIEGAPDLEARIVQA